MLNGLDLFTGIGGISLALEEWVRPVAYCEIDPYCQGVLLSRMADGSLSRAPIWDDIKTLSGQQFAGKEIDIIYGGFPCQNISVAGNGEGLEGERSGLFFEIMRLAKEIKPKFIFLENVPAITTRGGLRVVREIAQMGYGCRWCVISASSIGAPHKRDRWFLLAYKKMADTDGSGLERQCDRAVTDESTFSQPSHDGEDVSNSRCECQRSKEKPKWPSLHFAGCNRFWEVEPDICRVANGVQLRVDKLRSLGNAVVPKQAKEAFKMLMGLYER